ELLGQGRKNAIQLCRCKQRRRTTAEVDRIDIRTALLRSSYFFGQRRNITLREFTLIQTRSEVAVGTTRATKWNMNVETCGCHRLTQIIPCVCTISFPGVLFDNSSFSYKSR